VLALPLLLLVGPPVAPGHAQPTSITDTTVDDIYAYVDALGWLAPGSQFLRFASRVDRV